MSDQQSQQRQNRIDDTLQNLFESLLPSDVIEHGDVGVQQYMRDLIKNAKGHVHQDDSEFPPDTNQAQDLIKRKLLRENSSPQKAARFSNLYSRLLGIGVLNQKWAILYLLYRLADTLPDDNTGEHEVARSPLEEIENPRYTPVSSRRRSVPANGATKMHQPESRFEPEGNLASFKDLVERPVIVPMATDRQSPQQRPRIDRREKSGVNDTSGAQQVPSELDLLRDLPFNLQGLSSANIDFISPDTVQLPKTLPVPILSVLHTLAEPCLLYKGLSEYTATQATGLMNQSLSAAISNELRSYLGLVATLEGEIRRALVALEKGDSNRKAVQAAGVTLKRCVIWTRDATLGLRLMSLIVAQSKRKRGGQIITLIHNLSSSYGDPFVGSFAEKLLEPVARPFYDILRRWIYDGELIDPYNEFFVVETDPNAKADVDPRRVATSIWEDKYKIEETLIPSIISPEFAKKIFLIGKSLNFIRHNCGDSDWVIEYSQTHSKPLDGANTATLSSSIDDAYQTTMSRLTDLMDKKFLLFTHIRAIKKYLLLSQGDFIELLVESLAPNLDRPAHSQYRHTLTSQLEHAIRHSNAQYEDPEVLRRLDARMLELGRGDTGWDCFTLEYKVSPPCDVIITQWASTQYLRVFNLLLRVKRVEYSLSTTWRRCMTGARGVLATVGEKLDADWKRARCVVAEMVHFVNQLQYYILFEVIEASWETLQAAMNKPNATLDDLIEAHTKYLKNITQKGLLSSHADREEAFLVQLHHILRCMLSYREAVDGLYSYSVAEFTKRQQFSATVERRTAAGKWGITENDFPSRSSPPFAGSKSSKHAGALSGTDDSIDSPLLPNFGSAGATNDAAQLTSLRSRLLQLSTEFKSRVSVLLYDLAHQPDIDMRFLGVVMNFNEVYRPVNRKRRERERERRDAEKKARAATATAANTSVVVNETLGSGDAEDLPKS